MKMIKEVINPNVKQIKFKDLKEGAVFVKLKEGQNIISLKLKLNRDRYAYLYNGCAYAVDSSHFVTLDSDVIDLTDTYGIGKL